MGELSWPLNKRTGFKIALLSPLGTPSLLPLVDPFLHHIVPAVPMGRLSLKGLECMLTLHLGHLPNVPQVHFPGPTCCVSLGFLKGRWLFLGAFWSLAEEIDWGSFPPTERKYLLSFGWALIGVEKENNRACDHRILVVTSAFTYTAAGFHRAETRVRQAGFPGPQI